MSRRPFNPAVLVLLTAFIFALPLSAAEFSADPNFPILSSQTNGFTLGLPTAVQWTPDDAAILFLRSSPRSFVRDLFQFDVATGREQKVLTAQQLLAGSEEHLSTAERARRERMRQTARGLASYQLSEDGARILVNLSGHLFWVQRADGKISEIASDKGTPLDPRFSPDAALAACVRDGDLYVHDLATGAQRRLTSTASPNISNGLSEFVAQEEMDRFEGYWWSPDSQSILYQETDTSGVERMHILDSSDPLAPADEWPYPRPGQQNASVRLGLVPAAGGETRWLAWDLKRWPYLCSVRWDKNAPLTLLVMNRTQTEEALLAVDPQSGAVSPLLQETDEAWLNLDQSVPRWLPDGTAFLWSTERNGAPELELRARDGKLVRSLVPPALGYHKLVSLDVPGTEALVEATGEPTERHFYSVSLASAAAPVPITPGPGRHSLTPSPNHRFWILHSETLAGRDPYSVCRRDGTVAGTLHSMAEDAPFLPRLELTTVGTDPAFHVGIVRPRDFDPAKSYPVIESVYGGPGFRFVVSAAYSFLMEQWMADHGFIVVSIDGRGTPGRGRAWEKAIRGDFISLPLQDHVAAIRALGARYPELDLKRVGVYGWSFGGYYSAMAVMRQPDLYRAAVAGAPVADWLFYDTFYTERYLGLPQDDPEGYRKSSVLTYAEQLSRPLLLVHGTTDDNVYFLHSLRISDALLRAGKPFEFLPLANLTHMVADPRVKARLEERIMEFFLRNLASSQP